MRKKPRSCLGFACYEAQPIQPNLGGNWLDWHLAVLFSRQILNGSQDFCFLLIHYFLFIFLNMKPLKSIPAPFSWLFFSTGSVCRVV